MCPPCWGQVPKDLADEVWAAWRARQRARGGMDALEEAVERHDKACKAAIAHVQGSNVDDVQWP